MKGRTVILVLALLAVSYAISTSFAQKQAPDNIILQIEGKRLAPVPFPHALHVDKAKIDCAKCHHADKDPTQPDRCVKCHPVTAPPNVTNYKDAYHKQCIDCHKAVVAKGTKAPTKCAECHKK